MTPSIATRAPPARVGGDNHHSQHHNSNNININNNHHHRNNLILSLVEQERLSLPLLDCQPVEALGARMALPAAAGSQLYKLCRVDWARASLLRDPASANQTEWLLSNLLHKRPLRQDLRLMTNQQQQSSSSNPLLPPRLVSATAVHPTSSSASLSVANGANLALQPSSQHLVDHQRLASLAYLSVSTVLSLSGIVISLLILLIIIFSAKQKRSSASRAYNNSNSNNLLLCQLAITGLILGSNVLKDNYYTDPTHTPACEFSQSLYLLTPVSSVNELKAFPMLRRSSVSSLLSENCLLDTSSWPTSNRLARDRPTRASPLDDSKAVPMINYIIVGHADQASPDSGPNLVIPTRYECPSRPLRRASDGELQKRSPNQNPNHPQSRTTRSIATQTVTSTTAPFNSKTHFRGNNLAHRSSDDYRFDAIDRDHDEEHNVKQMLEYDSSTQFINQEASVHEVVDELDVQQHKQPGDKSPVAHLTSSYFIGLLMDVVASVHVWTVAALAYERYCAIANPLQYLRSVHRARTRIFMAFLWTSCVALNLALPLSSSLLADRSSGGGDGATFGDHNSWSCNNSADYGASQAANGCTLSAASGLRAMLSSLSEPSELGVALLQLRLERQMREQALMDSSQHEGWRLVYSALCFVAFILGPLLLVSVCNVSIYRIVKVHERRLSVGSGSHAGVCSQASSSSLCRAQLEQSPATAMGQSPSTQSAYYCGYNQYIQNHHHHNNNNNIGWHNTTMSAGGSSTCSSLNTSVASSTGPGSSAKAFVLSKVFRIRVPESGPLMLGQAVRRTVRRQVSRQDSYQRVAQLLSQSTAALQSSSAPKPAVTNEQERASELAAVGELATDKSTEHTETFACTQSQRQRKPTLRLKRKLSAHQLGSTRKHSSASQCDERCALSCTADCNGGRASSSGDLDLPSLPLHTSAVTHQRVGWTDSLTSSTGLTATSTIQSHTHSFMGQLRLAGLSFAGVAVNELSVEGGRNSGGAVGGPGRAPLHKSASLSLGRLDGHSTHGQPAIGNRCGAESASGRRCYLSGLEPRFVQQARLAATQHAELTAQHNNHPSGGGLDSVKNSITATGLPSELSQLANSHSHYHGHNHNNSNTNGHTNNHFHCHHVHHGGQGRLSGASLGTKSPVFNVVMWSIMAMLVLVVPHYLLVSLSQLRLEPFERQFITIDLANSKAIEMPSLSQVLHHLLDQTAETGKITSTTSNKEADLDQPQTINSDTPYSYETNKSPSMGFGPASIWLSCMCRLLFLSLTPLNGWLYGIHSRSLRATIDTVLERYISHRQACIEIRARQRSSSSMRSRESTLVHVPALCQQHQHLHNNTNNSLKQQQHHQNSVRRCSSSSTYEYQMTPQTSLLRTAAQRAPLNQAFGSDSTNQDSSDDADNTNNMGKNRNGENQIRFLIGDYSDNEDFPPCSARGRSNLLVANSNVSLGTSSKSLTTTPAVGGCLRHGSSSCDTCVVLVSNNSTTSTTTATVRQQASTDIDSCYRASTTNSDWRSDLRRGLVRLLVGSQAMQSSDSCQSSPKAATLERSNSCPPSRPNRPELVTTSAVGAAPTTSRLRSTGLAVGSALELTTPVNTLGPVVAGTSNQQATHSASHLQPPGFLRLVFDQSTGEFGAGPALSPIKECSSTHSYASSRESLAIVTRQAAHGS